MSARVTSFGSASTAASIASRMRRNLAKGVLTILSLSAGSSSSFTPMLTGTFDTAAVGGGGGASSTSAFVTSAFLGGGGGGATGGGGGGGGSALVSALVSAFPDSSALASPFA